MVIAYHLVLTCFGFWLPNDQRGSGSRYVGMDELYELMGDATTVTGNRSVAHRAYDPSLRTRARALLPRPPVRLSNAQIEAVTRGIGAYAEKSGVRLLALAVLPDHVHAVALRHEYRMETVCNQFKGSATRELRERGLWRSWETPWARGQRIVFLDEIAHVRQAIAYAKRNLAQYGRSDQVHDFLAPRPEWL